MWGQWDEFLMVTKVVPSRVLWVFTAAPGSRQRNCCSSLPTLKGALGPSQMARGGGRQGTAVSGHSPAFTACRLRSFAGDPRHSGCERVLHGRQTDEEGRLVPTGLLESRRAKHSVLQFPSLADLLCIIVWPPWGIFLGAHTYDRKILLTST